MNENPYSAPDHSSEKVFEHSAKQSRWLMRYALMHWLIVVPAFILVMLPRLNETNVVSVLAYAVLPVCNVTLPLAVLLPVVSLGLVMACVWLRTKALVWAMVDVVASISHFVLAWLVLMTK